MTTGNPPPHCPHSQGLDPAPTTVPICSTITYCCPLLGAKIKGDGVRGSQTECPRLLDICHSPWAGASPAVHPGRHRDPVPSQILVPLCVPLGGTTQAKDFHLLLGCQEDSGEERPKPLNPDHHPEKEHPTTVPAWEVDAAKLNLVAKQGAKVGCQRAHIPALLASLAHSWMMSRKVS